MSRSIEEVIATVTARPHSSLDHSDRFFQYKQDCTGCTEMAVSYIEAISRISTYLDDHPLRSQHDRPSSSASSSSSAIPSSNNPQNPNNPSDPKNSKSTTIEVPIEHSVGEILARDYRATINAPPFDNSGEWGAEEVFVWGV